MKYQRIESAGKSRTLPRIDIEQSAWEATDDGLVRIQEEYDELGVTGIVGSLAQQFQYLVDVPDMPVRLADLDREAQEKLHEAMDKRDADDCKKVGLHKDTAVAVRDVILNAGMLFDDRTTDEETYNEETYDFLGTLNGSMTALQECLDASRNRDSAEKVGKLAAAVYTMATSDTPLVLGKDGELKPAPNVPTTGPSGVGGVGF